MNILIIDGSVSFREIMGAQLSRGIKNATVDIYEFEALGKPADNFDWAKYDILLMDYNLGGEGIGLDWLKEYRRRPDFPPVIMLSEEGNEYVAVKAIKFGASNYLNKKDIEKKSLSKLVRSTAGESTLSDKSRTQFTDEATQIFDKPDNSDELEGRELSIGYKLYSKIAHTAMSRVYLAEKIGNPVTVVVKILDLRNVKRRRLITRFQRESEFIAQMNVPFVVKVYDSGFSSEFGYIAMEFFSRGDLKERIKKPVTTELALLYMQHIMHGLAAIHGKGIIHRDLKPANIMFRSDDSLALADFGISKQMNDESSDTTRGRVLGTPYYMSPEQGNGFDVDERSDIYSAGIVFFELLSGRKPYRGTSMFDVVYKHNAEAIPRLDSWHSHFQTIIENLLAKKPEDRYQSADKVIEALDEVEAKHFP